MRIGIGTSIVGQGVAGEAGEPFDPLSLFANGEEGVWYDPSDLSSLAQNSDGTGTVTVGDPVGYMADKSGNDNHATQATAGARPTLEQTAGGLYYLDFDGVDDGMATSVIGFNVTDKMSVFVGVRSLSDTNGIIAETSNQYYTTNGAFGLFRISSGAYSFSLSTSTTAISGFSNNNTSVRAASDLAILSFGKDIGAATEADMSVFSHVNGVTDVASTRYESPSTATSFVNTSLNIGARDNASSVYYDGYIFGLIVRGASSDASEIDNAEAYLAGKSGVTL